MDSYYSLNRYLRETFGVKLYKLALNGGMTCPNRDGRLGSQGCIFCSRGGSGDCAASASLPISEQIEAAKRLIARLTPIPTHPSAACARFLQRPFGIRISPFCLSPPDRTACRRRFCLS